VDNHQAYQTLNVNSDTSLKDLKVSYRKLALELHPDKNKDDSAGPVHSMFKDRPKPTDEEFNELLEKLKA